MKIRIKYSFNVAGGGHYYTLLIKFSGCLEDYHVKVEDLQNLKMTSLNKRSTANLPNYLQSFDGAYLKVIFICNL